MKTHYTDTWGSFVGSQSTADFMQHGTNHAAPYTTTEIAATVRDYLSTLTAEFDYSDLPTWARFNFEWVVTDLCDLIHQSME